MTIKMKKPLTAGAAVLLCAAALLCGCGDKPSADTPANTSAAETAPAQTETALTAAGIFEELGKSGLCEELDTTVLFGTDAFASACPKLYGTDPSALTDGGVMFVGAGTIADEVSVLGGGEGLTELLKNRADIRAGDFSGYAPEEQTKAQNAIVFEHKGLSVLVISDRAEEIKKAIIAM